MERLDSILSGLSHLNLDGQIVDKQAYVSKLGGSCDVFSAWSNKHGKKVAVKQIREFMGDNESFAKGLAKEIRVWTTLEHENVYHSSDISLSDETRCRAWSLSGWKTEP